MFARLLIMLYAIVTYAIFFASVLYSLGFVGNYLVPKSIDVGGAASWSEAIVIDLLLLGIFAIQHSIIPRGARPRVLPRHAGLALRLLRLGCLGLCGRWWGVFCCG